MNVIANVFRGGVDEAAPVRRNGCATPAKVELLNDEAPRLEARMK
jgi:hypothetical protein